MGELSDIVVQFPYAGLFCLLLLGSIGFPFPEDAVLLSCGFLISRDVIMPLPAFLTVYSGILISDLFLYSVARKYGRALVTHRRMKKFFSREKLHSIEKKFSKFGWLFIIIGRQIIGLRAQTILVSGILSMPRRTFLFIDAFASALTIMIMVSLGYMGSNQLMNSHFIHIPGEYVLVVILFSAVLFSLIRWRRARQPMRNNGESTMSHC